MKLHMGLSCHRRSATSLLPRLLSQPAATLRTSTRRHHLRHPIAAADEDVEDRRRRHRNQIPDPSESRFQLHKSRGQHLLTNPRVLDSIVRRAHLRPSDTVLEIGPGTGNLTVKLLQSAHHVVAVEIDDRMVDALCRRVSNLNLETNLTVITQNALTTRFPHFDVCVANIPYGISSPLIAKLLFEPGAGEFRAATLLLQKEFARRLLAKPGDSEFNRLAANVRLVADVEFLMDVSKRDFVPCPKVDSSLVCVRPRPRGELPDVDLEEWLAFTRTCFGNKNKTLGAIFRQKKLVMELFTRIRLNDDAREVYSDVDDDEEDSLGTGGNKEEEEGASEAGVFKEKVIGILKAGGFDVKRPSKMSSEEFLQLLRLFNQTGILFNQKRPEEIFLDIN